MTKIKWWEPRDSYLPRVKSELSDLLSFWMWLRIAIIILTLAYIADYNRNTLFPDHSFYLFPIALFAIFGFLAIILLILAKSYWIPPCIVVDNKGIKIFHSSSAVIYRYKKIQSLVVQYYDCPEYVMKIEYGGKIKYYGINPKVDYIALKCFLDTQLGERFNWAVVD